MNILGMYGFVITILSIIGTFIGEYKTNIKLISALVYIPLLVFFIKYLFI